MKKIVFVISFLIFFHSLFSQVDENKKITTTPFNIGETLEFYSEILKENRKLNVYLPISYTKANAQNYPIIYLLDGSKDEDFIHIAGLVQFCSFSWVNIIEESIVVGIANVDRKRDFTFPSSDERDLNEVPTSGHSEQFIKFIESEVKPLISTTYSSNKNDMLIGQSLGGLLVTEILLKHPSMFSGYIIVSPSLWWDNQSLLKESVDKIKPPKKIYVAVGSEGPSMEGTAMSLISKLQTLRKKELENSLIIEYDILKDNDHGNILHEAVYKAFLRFKERSETTSIEH